MSTDWTLHWSTVRQSIIHIHFAHGSMQGSRYYPTGRTTSTILMEEHWVRPSEETPATFAHASAAQASSTARRTSVVSPCVTPYFCVKSLPTPSSQALPLTPLASDRLGRRVALFLGSTIMLGGVALQYAANSVKLFTAARIVSKFGVSYSNTQASLTSVR